MAEKSNLVWLDLEMSGLEPKKNTILEIATIITNSDLKILKEGPVIAIKQERELLDSMDKWNTKHHTASGLITRCLESKFTMEKAEETTLEFVKEYVIHKKAPLCGNSIWQDRRFLDIYMPKFHNFLHYRNIDVSSIKELVYRWYPKLPQFKKKNLHTALEDIRESISELLYYKKNIFV